MAALLGWALAGLPAFGSPRASLGILIDHLGPSVRHATDMVAVVNFDARGIDTLAEEFILLAAATGVAELLRRARGEESGPAVDQRSEFGPDPGSEALRRVGPALVGFTVLLGLYIVAHGHLSPGGGFQGGVVLASAVILVYLVARYADLRRAAPLPAFELAEAAGAAGFVVVGLAALAGGSAFLANVLPLGTAGQLPSAGTIPVLNLAVGVEVAGGITVVVAEFLEQTIVLRQRVRGRR